MLGKLLKYDLKYMLRNMVVFYILTIFFALTTRILFSLDQSIIVNILAHISSGCMFSMIGSVLINTMLRSWVRFKDSLYKDESYLTHTLPVTKNELYNSKFILTLVFFFVGFVVSLVGLFIAYYSKDNWVVLTNFVKSITTGLNITTMFFIVMAIILIFLEVFNAIQCGFLGIILGYRMNNGKTGFSVLFGFLAYLAIQTLILALVFAYGLFDSSVMELFKTGSINIDVEAFKVLAIITSILYTLFITAMNIVCRKILNKGVNVE